MSRSVRLVLAACAFLALADTGIVALALPPILLQLDTTVTGVAAVLGVYALVLAVALPAAGALRERIGLAATGSVGALLFALGSLVSGLAQSLELLLVARGVQAAGGAAVLAAAWAMLADGGAGTRLWRLIALTGTAAGPALGGALTQALGWRSIFLVQAPLALLALPAYLGVGARRRPADGVPSPGGSTTTDRRGGAATALPTVALALLSGALAAALFLTVLLLISGWSIEPLAAAAIVSLVPLTGLAAARVVGPAETRALAGCLLAAGGSAALAFLPDGSIAWTLVPLCAVGAGLGLGLPALAGELLPERRARDATRLLSVRHVGIALVLALLAPIAQHELTTTLDSTRERGAALILDANVDPVAKLTIAPELAQSVQTEDPRDGLEQVFAAERDDQDEDDLAEYDELERRVDETLVEGVIDGFAPAYLTTAGLALLAALALLADPRLRAAFPRSVGGRRDPAAAERRDVGVGRRAPARGARLAWPLLPVVALAGALALPALYGSAAALTGPDEVTIADPCQDRELPDSGGLTGVVQDAALTTLDRVACRTGSSREQLVLALVDEQEAERYQRRYGVDPRSVIDLAQLVLGG